MCQFMLFGLLCVSFYFGESIPYGAIRSGFSGLKAGCVVGDRIIGSRIKITCKRKVIWLL